MRDKEGVCGIQSLILKFFFVCLSVNQGSQNGISMSWIRLLDTYLHTVDNCSGKISNLLSC